MQPHGSSGPSPWGSPPPSAPWGNPPPPPRSNALKYVGIGCLAVLALTCAGGAAGMLFVRGAVMNLGPGHEVASTLATPGVPFSLTYVPSKRDETAVWLDLDVGYAQGVQLTGPIAVRVGGTPVAQYNVNLTSGSCTAPVREVSSSFCINWRTTSLNGEGSLSGQTRMFKIPAQAPGAAVTVSGMIFASPGVSARRLRVFASE